MVWDQWKIQKNELKHGVSCVEAESVFYNKVYKLFKDEKHSSPKEIRSILYGKGIENRLLMVGFAVRKGWFVPSLLGQHQKRSAKFMKTKRKIKPQVIEDFDSSDTPPWVNADKPLVLSEIGVSLPSTPPTQVVSIRLPTSLLNELRALGSEQDVPYQALIKLFLADAVARRRKGTSSQRR